MLSSLLSSDGSVCVFSASAAGTGPTVRGDGREAGGELDHGEDVRRRGVVRMGMKGTLKQPGFSPPFLFLEFVGRRAR